MQPTRLLSALLVGLSTLVACSSNNDATKSSEQFLDQYCDNLVPCCSPAAPGSKCTLLRTLHGATVAHNYDRTKGDACLGELRAHAGDARFCQEVSSLSPSCASLFQGGTTAIGGTCESDFDCVSSPEGLVRCARTGPGAPSICQVLIVGKEGDSPCLGTIHASGGSFLPSHETRGYTCNDHHGIYCATDGRCAKTKAIGAACEAGDLSCGADARCDMRSKTCDATAARAPSPAGLYADPMLYLACPLTP